MRCQRWWKELYIFLQIIYIRTKQRIGMKWVIYHKIAGCYKRWSHLLPQYLTYVKEYYEGSWWRYQMETFSALLTLCAGNSPVTGAFPTQRAVTQSFLMFSLICAWINGWANNREAGAHFDVAVMIHHSSGGLLKIEKDDPVAPRQPRPSCATTREV